MVTIAIERIKHIEKRGSEFLCGKISVSFHNVLKCWCI